MKTLNDVQLAIFGLCDIQSLMKLSTLGVSQCVRYHSVGEGCAFQKIYNLYAFYSISDKKFALNPKILRKMHILWENLKVIRCNFCSNPIPQLYYSLWVSPHTSTIKLSTSAMNVCIIYLIRESWIHLCLNENVSEWIIFSLTKKNQDEYENM